MAAWSLSDAPSARRLGRFTLLGELGRGAQATVWLARDTELEREVAVKLMHPSADGQAEAAWLQEARLMATLSHPGIVTVHEVGRAEGQVYLVLERVRGSTLAQRVREGGALPPREAAQHLVEVLDALSFAHEHGIVHRDLKPSNVLLGERGARVMDFGIAARVQAAHDGRIVGTPSTISPEAAAGAAPTPLMDVYSAGMLLGHLLTGRPLRQEADPMRSLQRARDEDVRWPSDVPAPDPQLLAIVLRAAARDPASRFPDARAMREALQAWLAPEPVAVEAATHGTLEFLLRRMRLQGGFPALSDSVSRIQRVVASESGSLQALSAEILKDVALTHQLLRLVNTAHFRRTRAGEVTTVSRAAALVGFSAIRNMALSVLLLEHLQDRQQALRMRGLFLRALMTATLADQLTPSPREREEAFLAGMLSHLGRLLVHYYFPEEAARVGQRLPDPARALPQEEDRAAEDVLGLSYEALGQGVARSWNLPDSQRELMRRPEGGVPRRRLESPQERMRWRVRLASEVVLALLQQGDPAALEEALTDLAQRHAMALDLHPADILEAVRAAQDHLTELAASLKLALDPQCPERCLAGLPGPARVTTGARGVTGGAPSADLADPTVCQGAKPGGVAPEHTRTQLAAGIADVTRALAADRFKLNEVLRQVLGTMSQALGFHHVIFCLRDAATGKLTGRFGLGDGADVRSRSFIVDVRGGAQAPDLFAAACRKGMDTLIADAQAPKLQPSLPTWFRQQPSRSFLLLPMSLRGEPFALIYADLAAGPPLKLDEVELDLLRTLRNQAVLAFKSA